MAMDRHGRQTRLAEVGGAGQARIAAARVAITLEGTAARVAARYLAGAGVGGLRVRSAEIATQARAVDPGVFVEVDAALGQPPPSTRLPLRDPSAEAIALGAFTALAALRGILGVPA
jgi:hypothetical protein